jgi:dTDP-4-amino-4,6-dideoxygalactose transaminase
MLSAISRYGARWVPDFEQIVDRCRRHERLVNGPERRAFEDAFSRRLGGGHAASTSYGRMAAYYILKALDLPPGSEVVFPALTFWVVPEMARAAGLKPVFADVDPVTFNLDPDALERVLTPRTRAVVPTHVYGLPCDMDEILAIAGRHSLRVIEDCAHALGASYRGQPAGTLSDAALFSFQVLKPLNTCGGGLAFTRDRALAARIASLAEAEPEPAEGRVRKRLRLARLERALMSPSLFSLTAFPILWTASLWDARPDVYLWEKVRPLTPFPDGYRARYANVQAALGLAGLERLDDWTEATRGHAHLMTRALSGLPGVMAPQAPSDRIHVYYQYCAYVPDRDATVRACLRRGLDVEYHHMDVCPDLPLFGESATTAPGARRTADALQLPVYAGLSDVDVRRVADRLRRALHTGPAEPAPVADAPNPR